ACRRAGRLQQSRPGLTARAFCWALSKQDGAPRLRPLSTMRAAVAQLVRALGCGPRGRWFESTQLYQMRRVGLPPPHPQSSSRAGGNEARRRFEHVGITAEGAQRGLRLADQVFEPPPRGRGSEHADQRCLMGGRVLARRFADRRRIAFDVEEIVGDLERLAKRGTVTLKRGPLTLVGL